MKYDIWQEIGKRALLSALFLFAVPVLIGCSSLANRTDQEENVPVMTKSVTPFLMFEGKAQEAMDFYVELFPNSRVLEVQKFGDANSSAPDLIMFAKINISGQDIILNDSPIEHAFTFTPSISLFVECESENEITRLATALGENGKILMPLDSYDFATKFTWVEDRFGVSWQLFFE